MTLTFDPMTLKTYSVYLHAIMSYHVKFGEDTSTTMGDITKTNFSTMNSCDLDL